MRKSLLLLTTTILTYGALQTPASASDIDRIESLEKQLAKAMKLIEAQSKQMAALQSEIRAVKSNKKSSAYSISAKQQDITAAKAAGIEPAAGEKITHANLHNRLSEIENVVYDLDEKVGSKSLAKAFDASRFDIGGFVNTAFTHVEGEDGSASAWNRQNFELLIRADLNDQWSAFFAGGWLREGNIGFDDDGDGTLNEAGERRNPDFAIESGVAAGTRNPQIIAWANYKHNDAFNLKMGRMITPHGIINIEHFPNILLDQEQPLFLRPFGGQTMFPNFTTGLQAHGKFFFGNDTLEYNAYSAAAQDAAEELIHGSRIGYTFGDEGISIGINAAHGSRSEAASTGDYTLVGADLLIDKGQLLWKNEIFSTSEEDALGRLAFYTQPAWEISDQWTVFYRYDFLDDGTNTISAVPDNEGNVTEHMLGINFLPLPSVRTRLTATRRDYHSTGTIDDAQADIYQFSTTYSF